MHLVLLYQADAPIALAGALLADGVAVTLTRGLDDGGAVGLQPDVVLVVCLDGGMHTLQPIRQRHRRGIPWLAWNRSDDQTQALLAYAAGAAAVLPGMLTVTVLQQTLATIGALRPRAVPRPGYAALHRRYARGAPIALAHDQLLEPTGGVVAQWMLHPDGHEALLGLYGPGHVLLGHPDDDCAIRWVAHTAVAASIRGWQQVDDDARLRDQLARRIRWMEAWAAAQALPFIDQRLMALLQLLATQFGVPCHAGTSIDVRLPHTMLATAVSATRSTVTRWLGELRQRGELVMLGSGERERICVVHAQANHHDERLAPPPAPAARAV
jgi:hypothetical protein